MAERDSQSRINDNRASNNPAVSTGESPTSSHSISMSKIDLRRRESLLKPEDKWSWDPKVWLSGLCYEFNHFSDNFVVTDKSRLLYRAILGEFLVTWIQLFILMGSLVNNNRQDIPENLVFKAFSYTLSSVALSCISNFN